MEDKTDKRNQSDPKARPSSLSSPSSSPVLHPRKPPPPSRSPTPSTSSLTPLPPLSSPVTTLKSEQGGQRVSSHPPKLFPHPPSPCSASPPPSSPRQPKQEVAEEGEVGRREQRERQKPVSAPFQGVYSGESSLLKVSLVNQTSLHFSVLISSLFLDRSPSRLPIPVHHCPVWLPLPSISPP